MAIQIENLSYTYLPGTPFEHVALRDINLHIETGSFVGIVGHTGSGKSTLAQIMSGLIKGYTGTVRINGIDYADKKADRALLRRTVGVVFQYPEYQLFEETVEKDIAYGPRKLGISEKEIDNHVKVAMELVGLDYDLYRYKSPFSLSGGQKRKAAIAGVLAMEPSILIMDEPIAGLDPMGRESFMALSQTLNEVGITIVMISHNMDNLAEYASKVIVMNEGEVFMQGTPEAVFAEKEKIKEASIDVPETVAFADKLREKGMEIPADLIRYEQIKAYLIEQLGGAQRD